ncbi:MAG: NUDIX domain-containing protein [Bacteroidota bacterium]
MSIQTEWQKISGEVKYDNPWIKVTEDQVLNPAGNPGIYAKVHFKNLAIGIVPVDSNGYIYFVRQFRYVLNSYSLEIPEGGGPLDIDPLETAKKELKEKTGFSADRWTPILDMHLSNSVSDERSIVYLAEDLTEGMPEPDDTEVFTIHRHHIDEVLQMIDMKEITDAITIAAIFKVKLMLLSKK